MVLIAYVHLSIHAQLRRPTSPVPRKQETASTFGTFSFLVIVCDAWACTVRTTID